MHGQKLLKTSIHLSIYAFPFVALDGQNGFRVGSSEGEAVSSQFIISISSNSFHRITVLSFDQ